MTLLKLRGRESRCADLRPLLVPADCIKVLEAAHGDAAARSVFLFSFLAPLLYPSLYALYESVLSQFQGVVTNYSFLRQRQTLPSFRRAFLSVCHSENPAE
jgi:hypothetical protein